jgi:hypothetical protein
MTRDSMEQYNVRRARVTLSGCREPTYLADELWMNINKCHVQHTVARRGRTTKITTKNMIKNMYGAMSIWHTVDHASVLWLDI